MVLVAYGAEYSCARAVKGEDSIVLYDEQGIPFVRFEGISDFSGYEIIDGKWESDRMVKRNVVAGELITINGKLYRTTQNIPNGGELIVGQNSIETTYEKELFTLNEGE